MRTRWLALATVALIACGDDDEEPVGPNMDASTTDAAVSDAASMDAQVDAAAPADCFTNPKTYLEIINACTDAEKVVKNPVLPLIGADGKLPTLP